MLNLLLIMPDGRINRLSLFSVGLSFREAPLTLTTLAALVPRELECRITLVDRSIGTRVPYSRSFSIVGISIMTGTSAEGYMIADRFRSLGVPVVLGGVHVTLCPEEAARHADAIVTGFAEESWPRLLKDFVAGRLRRRYAQNGSLLANLPSPRRDLQRRLGYLVPYTVMATRGCRGSCDFCSVPAARFGWHKRPVGEVIEEIARIPARRFAISDVHLTEEREYALELFAAMIPLEKKWGALASTRVAEDPELLEMMRRSGCSYLLLGFESWNQDSLRNIHKRFNDASQYGRVVSILHDYGITVQGCFIFGFDEDRREIFDNTVAFVNDLKIDIPRYALYTPYPGTGAFDRLETEGRLLHTDWRYYDTQHAVIRPRHMSPRELDRGLLRAYEQTFRFLPSLRRSRASGGPEYITLLGNLAYKIYIRRLKNDCDRFPKSIPEIELEQTCERSPI